MSAKLTQRQEDLLKMNWLEVAELPLSSAVEITLSTLSYTVADIDDGDIKVPPVKECITTLSKAYAVLQDNGNQYFAGSSYSYYFTGSSFSLHLPMHHLTRKYMDCSLFVKGLNPLQYEILISFFDDRQYADRLKDFVGAVDAYHKLA